MIEKILIISLFTIGYCCTFWPGMIFEKAGEWLDDHLPDYLNKPLWKCYICTSFWLGTFLYLLIWRTSFLEWAITVIPAMGLNAVISELTNKDEGIEITGTPDIKISELAMQTLEQPPAHNNVAPLRAECPRCGLWQQCNYVCDKCSNDIGVAYCANEGCDTIIASKKIDIS